MPWAYPMVPHVRCYTGIAATCECHGLVPWIATLLCASVKLHSPSLWHLGFRRQEGVAANVNLQRTSRWHPLGTLGRA